MAEIVLRAAVLDAGLADRVRVSSSGTGNWHIGGGANPPARRVLEANGFPSEHVAHQVSRAELPTIDLVLAADRSHLDFLKRLDSGAAERIVLLRAFDPDADHDEVPDPYGGPDTEFVEVLEMIRAAAPGVIAEIRRRLTSARPQSVPSRSAAQ